MRKSIGIIGGAGPHAGALLYEKIIQVCQEKYGCHKDADFPYMLLLNIPFSDMLDAPDEACIREELRCALKTLELQGVDRVAIACNTLHGFLPGAMSGFEFVDLRSVVPDRGEEVLILCTSTSRERAVYAHLKKGVYLGAQVQEELDQLIDRILAGKVDRVESSMLSKLVGQGKGAVLLGCTEISLLHARFPLELSLDRVVDPLQLLAEALCKQ